MKSLRCLRQNYLQLNIVRHVFLQETNGSCFLSKRAPLVSMATSEGQDTPSLPSLHQVVTHHNTALTTFNAVFGNINPLWFITDVVYHNDFMQKSINKIKLPTLNTDSPVFPILPKIDIIGDDYVDNTIIGYQPTVSGSLNCSNILKKRKQKMNKHKYKKRRKRDKFKRRNLENIRERKRKTKEKAEERAKQVAV